MMDYFVELLLKAAESFLTTLASQTSRTASCREEAENTKNLIPAPPKQKG